MIVFKPRYVKRGGSIKELIRNPIVQKAAVDIATGAVNKLLGKRKAEDIINTVSKVSKVFGSGIVYE